MGDKQEQVSVFANTGSRRFEARTIEGYKAVLEYYIEGNSIVFTHTGVPDAIECLGVGAALARAGLDYARQRRPYRFASLSLRGGLHPKAPGRFGSC
jgi:predicted GNAT family acetyltransferase